MKKAGNNKNSSIKTRVIAGVLAALMFATVVFGVLMYLV